MRPYPSEIWLEVEVEVLSASVAWPGRLGDRPERCSPPEPTEVELAVWLGTNGARVNLTAYLPVDVREALEAEALERLEDAATAALLP